MKLYMLSAGEYSDYSVYGVFSTRENAIAASIKLSTEPRSWIKIDDFEIDEITVDPGIEEIRAGKQLYYVRMERNGDSDCEVQGGLHETAPYLVPHYMGGLSLIARTWQDSAERAIKVVNERRVAMIASGEWTESIRDLEKEAK